jgi:programmed cell death 6-interacting protein
MPTLSNLNIQHSQQPVRNPSPGYTSPPIAQNHQFAPQQQQPQFQQSYQQAYQQHQPPLHQQYQQPLQPQQQTTFSRPAVQSPAEASIQSWAGGAMQQPQVPPQPGQTQPSPVPGTWNPSMGIKFGGQSAGGPQGQEGTWSAGSGIRFG